MSRLNDLLRQLRDENVALATEIEREVKALADRRAFGLNFERHVPETVELPGRKVRKGDKVRVLPPRGTTPKKSDERLWRVISIDRTGEAPTATLEALDNAEALSSAVDDLVVVAEFRDPIYPGLVSTGKVERGGDKPFHTVINAENYHALQTLLFTHRGKVDCIYIDPPYNTGAKDWKYNNDYVEGDDLYRHSKWLAFMERRLLVARELLRPDDSVLIATIDANELHRFGLLLEQLFPEALRQLVTIAINPGGSAGEGLSRVEEYAVFCFLGAATPAPGDDDLLITDAGTAKAHTNSEGVRWEWLIRGGSAWYRRTRPNLCYPVVLNQDGTRIVGVGDPLVGPDEGRPLVHQGLPLAWPVRGDGALGIWRVDGRKLLQLSQAGYAYVSRPDPVRGTWTIKYLMAGTVAGISRGDIDVLGHDEVNGRVVLLNRQTPQKMPRTMWVRGRHTAGGAGGTMLVSALLGSRRGFPFPKSLYAVEDAVQIAVARKPDALILDFFAGSGTTAHAVARLNKKDGGQRRSILITNNEVAAAEQKALRERRLRPGDSGWEQHGICEYITKPRIQAAITGLTPQGEPVKGDYKFTDEFPMADGFDENVEFFTLTYEAPLRMASNREFAKIAPLLWLRAGSRGRRIDDISRGWDVAERYGVIAELDHTEEFLKAVAAASDIAIAYIVTDEDRLFESLAQELPDHVEPVRLYEAYLRNFEIESGRGAL